MPAATPSATMSCGDPPSIYHQIQARELMDQQVFSAPIWATDVVTRLDKLEKIMDQLDKEEKIREKNLFVQELYDQYKVALVLLEDPDE